MSKNISIDDLTNLIALKMGRKYSPDTVRRFLAATEEVILDELELNGRIRFYNFGIFETYEFGGYDVKLPDFWGGEDSIIRYIKPRTKVRFSASKTFENAINNGFELPKKKSKKRKTAKVDPDREKYDKKVQPTMGECIANLLND